MGDKQIFHNYNELKPVAEQQRLNKALAIAQSKPKETNYFTTKTTCTCPDHTYRGVRCKHMLALILQDNTLSTGDQVSPILFPEIIGPITELDGDIAVVQGREYFLAELTRR